MKKVKKTPIKGYDWAELLPYLLNQNYKNEEDSVQLEKLIKRIEELSYIVGCESKKITKKDKDDLKIVRKFINRLAPIMMKNCCSGELFVGLSKIKDNGTFLKYVSILLGDCWN